MFWDARTNARLMAVVVTLYVAGTQSRYFDCNGLPVLSFLSAIVTLVLLYGVGEKTFDVATSEEPLQARLGATAVVVLIGGALVAGAGFFTLLTHICP